MNSPSLAPRQLTYYKPMPPSRASASRLAVSLLFLAACILAAWAAAPAGVADLKRAFENPPDDARVMMRWWWFGPAVEKPELERELQTMKRGGIGGVEIQPVYPVALDDPVRGIRNFQYLSPEFLDDVRFANVTARNLGMRVDITLGSGWPYGGPHTSIDLAAPRLRVDRVPVPANAASVPIPTTREGEKLIAAFLARGDARQFSSEGIRRLADIDAAVARVPADPAPGRVVLFFISSRTRMAVKRAAIGAEGFVLDHYSRAAIDEHLKSTGEPLLQAFGKNPPYAVFSDSLEVAGTDWSTDFLQEFQRRRGYDLTPYLPALAGDIGEKTAAIRHDWGQTLTDLVNENYLAPITEWARRHGTLFRSQTYGSPPVNLSSNALIDLPEGEGSQWHGFSTTRWATSANHLYGRPISSSETWTWLHSPVFRATPLDMKAEADLHFLQGVNQLVGHGWPYSPPQAEEPGWHFYAAAVFNAHNPWWLVMPDITRYLQRISYLLRQGKPVADVAVYLPTDDIYARFTPGRISINEGARTVLSPNLVPAILDAGFNLDFIDDDAIAQVGIPYPILVLPNVERISLATYRRIDDYARKGGLVIAVGRMPALAPGRMDAAAETVAIRRLSGSLFAGPAAPGRLVPEVDLGNVLRARLTPDMDDKPPEIGFVHRSLPDAEVYFLVNTSNHAVAYEAAFRVTGGEPVWLNPFSGAATKAVGRNPIRLELAPYESKVLVFSEHSLEAGRKMQRLVPIMDNGLRSPDPTVLELSGGWKVSFAGSAQAVNMDRLASWTESETTRYFSGQATYEKTITVGTGRSMYLDFGEGTPVEAPERRSGSGMRAMLESPVREAAVVFVNGQRAGSVWCPPYQLEITSLLHPGENSLRIVVANLAINALAHQPLPDYKPLIAKYGNRFQDQDMSNLQPLPAGLLGPLRLMAK